MIIMLYKNYYYFSVVNDLKIIMVM
jgi:hypothetical protein